MRKNGFTLIELLAVIVILAIIALIATPIILGIINDAREKANERSVELYASAIKNGIAVYQLREGKEVAANTYTKDTLPFEVEYDGKVECTSIIISENGQVSLNKCTVNGGTKEYNYGNIPSNVCYLSNDANKNGELDLADEVTCANEQFIVIPNDSEAHPDAQTGNITLFAKYNLNVGNDTNTTANNLQNLTATGANFNPITGKIEDFSVCNFTEQDYESYIETNGGSTAQNELNFYNLGYGCNGTLPFSTTKYWGDVESGTFIYNSQSLLYDYVENYALYLKNNGINVKTASLVSNNQMLEAVDLIQNQGLYTNLVWTSFWLGSASSGDSVYGVASAGKYGAQHYYNGFSGGVRPVIIISKSEINI